MSGKKTEQKNAPCLSVSVAIFCRDIPTRVLAIGADPGKVDRPMTGVNGEGATLQAGIEI